SLPFFPLPRNILGSFSLSISPFPPSPPAAALKRKPWLRRRSYPVSPLERPLFPFRLNCGKYSDNLPPQSVIDAAACQYVLLTDLFLPEMLLDALSSGGPYLRFLSFAHRVSYFHSHSSNIQQIPL